MGVADGFAALRMEIAQPSILTKLSLSINDDIKSRVTPTHMPKLGPRASQPPSSLANSLDTLTGHLGSLAFQLNIEKLLTMLWLQRLAPNRFVLEWLILGMTHTKK